MMKFKLLPLAFSAVTILVSQTSQAEMPSLLITDADGRTYLQEDPKSKPQEFQIGDFHSREWELLLAQDLDNDLIDDYLLKNRKSGQLAMQPSPGLSEAKAYDLPLSLEPYQHVQSGDVNGDGAEDILILDAERNQIQALINLHEKPELVRVLQPKISVNDLVAAQIDGDDKVDFIGISSKATTLYLTNTRGSQHKEAQSHYLFHVETQFDGTLNSPRFMDLNNDGKKDVVFETEKGGVAAFELFSGSDGYIGLSRLGQPIEDIEFGSPIDSFDVDNDGNNELAVYQQRSNQIQFFSLNGENWKARYSYPLALDVKTASAIKFIPTIDFPLLFLNYVGVDQINEYFNIFSFATAATTFSSRLFIDPADVISPVFLANHRADFGVDIITAQQAFSVTANIYPTSATFTKMEPDAQGIFRPTGAVTSATISGKKISATLPQGEYRLRVLNHDSSQDLVTLSRYVNKNIQTEKTRLYPLVKDPVTDPNRDHYLVRRLNVVSDADDYYDRVAFFKSVPESQGRIPNFEDWFDYNNIEDKKVMNAVYINSGDLGFARNMFVTQKDRSGSVYAWVENYATLPEAVSASKSYKSFYDTFEPSPWIVFGPVKFQNIYSLDTEYVSLIDARAFELVEPINIFDILKPKTVKRDGLIATVVMEYHPEESQHGRLVSFMVFDGQGRLSTAANLDNRGAKENPGVCMSCHGGDYEMADNGDVGAGFVPWDLDTYIYSTDSDYTRSAQLRSFWGMNKEVKAMYPSNDPVYQLIDDWYPNILPSQQANFVGSNVMPQSFDNANKETLYREVTATSCRMCHVQPFVYNDIATDANTFVGAIGYKLHHTLDKDDRNRYAPDMPHAYLTFKNLWSRGHMSAIKAELGN